MYLIDGIYKNIYRQIVFKNLYCLCFLQNTVIMMIMHFWWFTNKTDLLANYYRKPFIGKWSDNYFK